MDNECNYYLGSIICINKKISDSLQPPELEIIDGQQRMTTLLLLLAATKMTLSVKKIMFDEEDDQSNLLNIGKYLRCDNSPNKLRLVPQTQNNNADDFISIMCDAGIIKSSIKRPNNMGNRRISKCYKYFCEQIELEIDKAINPILFCSTLLKKVLGLMMVKIEVSSSSEAYIMFESINKTGQPLSAIDLIKNSILSKADSINHSVDDCYESWKTIIDNLSDDYSIQERFFRQYYNAFRDRLNIKQKTADNQYPLGRLMTKSNMLLIYDKIISKDIKLKNDSSFINDLFECSETYAKLINPSEIDQYGKELIRLEHVQAAPSYQLLLYMFYTKKEWSLNDEDILAVINLLIRFFARRNITDVPPTRELIRLFTNMISELETILINTSGPDLSKLRGTFYSCVHDKLVSVSASEELFNMKLHGGLYEENRTITRFILCDLCESQMNKETYTDLWKKIQKGNSNQMEYIWSIEHIFPEGENIPEWWVKMIADGDCNIAKEYQKQYVHTLGNLTITAYNSNLGNRSFKDKKNRMRDGKYIGYLNGLSINSDVANCDTWTLDEIKSRTESLIDKIINQYKL